MLARGMAGLVRLCILRTFADNFCGSLCPVPPHLLLCFVPFLTRSVLRLCLD